MWQPGTHIPVRYVYDGVVRFAEPVTVVLDSPEHIIVYEPVGTPVQWSEFDYDAGDLGTPLPRIWHTRNMLKIYERNCWAGIWCWWIADGWKHDGWYVDFQRPLAFGRGGLVLKDLQLDIVVAPDLSWRWKDEDHFRKAQRHGWVSPEEASAVESEAAKIIKRIEGRAAPFNEAWPHWRPDPMWTIPQLPDDWREP